MAVAEVVRPKVSEVPNPAVSATGRVRLVLMEATQVAENGAFRELPEGAVIIEAATTISAKNVDKLLSRGLLRVKL